VSLGSVLSGGGGEKTQKEGRCKKGPNASKAQSCRISTAGNRKPLAVGRALSRVLVEGLAKAKRAPNRGIVSYLRKTPKEKLTGLEKREGGGSAGGLGRKNGRGGRAPRSGLRAWLAGGGRGAAGQCSVPS